MRAHTVHFLLDDGYFFVAQLSDGGVRVGIKNFVALDLSRDHKYFDDAINLTSQTVEDFIDERFADGSIVCWHSN